jgi:hypothetical protein
MRTTRSWYVSIIHLTNQLDYSKTFHCDLKRLTKLTSEVNTANASALKLLESLEARYPSQLVLVKTIKVAQFLLRTQRARINEHYTRGAIRVSTYEQVFDYLCHHLKQLKEVPFHYLKCVQKKDHGGGRRAERASPEVEALEGVQAESSKDDMSVERKILEFDLALYCEHVE